MATFIFGLVVGLIVGAVWMSATRHHRDDRYTDDGVMLPPYGTTAKFND